MKHQSKRLLIASLILASASFVRAEIVTHEIGNGAANVLNGLAKDFILGCAIVAASIVAAAFISKKK